MKKNSRAGSETLVIIEPVCAEKSKTKRLSSVLSHALKGIDYVKITKLSEFHDLQNKRILFAVSQGESGINLEYFRFLKEIRLQPALFLGSVAGVIVDGSSELYTKSIARELVFASNQSGCTFPGRCLVEGTASLQNFGVQAMLLQSDSLSAYKQAAFDLVRQILQFDHQPKSKPKLLVLHASNFETSNTVSLWNNVKSKLGKLQIKEISLRNGTVADCSGCPYAMCLHFSKKSSCYYGGVIAEQVYPSIEECDGLLLLCPNYNDAVSANLCAFINRLTSLFRKQRFYDKNLFAIIVSGYSGGDLVAGQLIGGLNMNKSFILPSRFAMLETANDPGSILLSEGIEARARDFAGHIQMVLTGEGLDLKQQLPGASRREFRLDSMKALVAPLLFWYEDNRRILPWRENPTPYGVWVSEIMLQQTRVEAGIEYYKRFMKKLPDVESLANVPDGVLMKLWEGLGYYNRARNLKKAAGVVMERFCGKLPCDFETLLTLPGIGSYTAGAIASIAFGKRVPAVDGNVLRVMSRITADYGDISELRVKKQWEERLLFLLGSEDFPGKRTGDFNQALMELGAVICIPNGAPRCEDCPVGSLCLSKEQGLTGELPVKKGKKDRRREDRTLLLLRKGECLGLQKRPDTGLLSGQLELPGVLGHLSAAEVEERLKGQGFSCRAIRPLKEAKHVFSHIEWHMFGYEVQLFENQIQPKVKRDVEDQKDDGSWWFVKDSLLWVSREALEQEHGLPSAFKAYGDIFLNSKE